MPPAILEVKGLGKAKLSALARQAKGLGMTPEEYVRNIVEERLEIVRLARTKTFAEISGPGTDVDETALDKAIEAARDRHHRRTRRKR
jgi:hypothetical protein